MVSCGVADTYFVQKMPERRWEAFRDDELLLIGKCVRRTVHFVYRDRPTACLAVWTYLVPDVTMQQPVMLGRGSWMRLENRQYQILPRSAKSRPLAELNPTYVSHYGNRS